MVLLHAEQLTQTTPIADKKIRPVYALHLDFNPNGFCLAYLKDHALCELPAAPLACRLVLTSKKKRKVYVFWRQFNEKPSIVLGCPGDVEEH